MLNGNKELEKEKDILFQEATELMKIFGAIIDKSQQTAQNSFEFLIYDFEFIQNLGISIQNLLSVLNFTL